jgi:hypothetical protein
LIRREAGSGVSVKQEEGRIFSAFYVLSRHFNHLKKPRIFLKVNKGEE